MRAQSAHLVVPETLEPGRSELGVSDGVRRVRVAHIRRFRVALIAAVPLARISSSHRQQTETRHGGFETLRGTDPTVTRSLAWERSTRRSPRDALRRCACGVLV